MNSKKLLFIVVFFASLISSVGFFMFRENFSEASKLGLFGIFIINFVSSASFFVSGPAFLTVIAGGSIYPILTVAIIASLGASLGDMVAYFFGFSGRHLAVKNLEKKSWFLLLDNIFTRYGTFVVFLFAIIPNPFFDGIGLFAGITGMKYSKFFLLMFVGRLMRFTLLAFIGGKI